ncbi:MAG: hypothetical protein IPL29_09095 [Propionivibrio sp.]|nr:hypothetical protein [Propionivibrio sp.]
MRSSSLPVFASLGAATFEQRNKLAERAAENVIQRAGDLRLVAGGLDAVGDLLESLDRRQRGSGRDPEARQGLLRPA